MEKHLRAADINNSSGDGRQARVPVLLGPYKPASWRTVNKKPRGADWTLGVSGSVTRTRC